MCTLRFSNEATFVNRGSGTFNVQVFQEPGCPLGLVVNDLKRDEMVHSMFFVVYCPFPGLDCACDKFTEQYQAVCLELLFTDSDFFQDYRFNSV